MNVLSLFDGMSCGRIALDRLNIPVTSYYAAEIDKYATQVSEANYPDIIRLGDVCGVKAEDLEPIDLLIAGSPCQGFSFAGKQLAFDDPRSALFFEFVRLLKECKPKYFLLENVRMKKEFLDIISEQVGCEPIMINSALVSAQNRVRFYWTNILGIEQPEQRGIVLRDILETREVEGLTDKAIAYMNRSSDKWSGGKTRKDIYIKDESEKSMCLTANMYKGVPYGVVAVDKPVKVGMNVEQVKVRKHEVDIISLQYLLRQMKSNSGKTNKQIAEETNMPVTKVEHWFRTDSSFAIPGDDIWLKLKEVLGIETDVFDKQIMEFEYRDGVYETKQRVYSDNGKSPTLTAGNTEQYIETHDTPKQVGTATDINGHDILKRVYSPDGKSPTVNTCQGGNREPKVITGGAIRGRAYDKEGKRMDKDGISVANKTTQMLELRKDDKSNAITTVGKDSLVVENEVYWRKLTCIECERLQTVPDDYTACVSNTQRYKMLGNGWNIETICHIFKNMQILEEGGSVKHKTGQLTLDF
jgi:DNA-cytosine methyltransferase